MVATPVLVHEINEMIDVGEALGVPLGLTGRAGERRQRLVVIFLQPQPGMGAGQLADRIATSCSQL